MGKFHLTSEARSHLWWGEISLHRWLRLSCKCEMKMQRILWDGRILRVSPGSGRWGCSLSYKLALRQQAARHNNGLCKEINRKEFRWEFNILYSMSHPYQHYGQTKDFNLPGQCFTLMSQILSKYSQIFTVFYLFWEYQFLDFFLYGWDSNIWDLYSIKKKGWQRKIRKSKTIIDIL